MAWWWTYDGDAATRESARFPSQDEAEAWLGEAWRDLREQGVRAVTLVEDERDVYGPMSLDPA